MATKVPKSVLDQIEKDAVTNSWSESTKSNALQAAENRYGTSKSNQSQSGITTSDETAAKVKSINEQIGKIQGVIDSRSGSSSDSESGSSSPFDALFKRISSLQTNLNTAKENEKKAREALANNETNAALNSLPSSEEAGSGASADLNAASEAIGGRGGTGVIEDPVIRAFSDKMIANVGIMNQKMQALSQYRSQFNEYTQQDIDSIARTAERSVTRQLAENDRVKRAMEFAGVLGGRAQFSPIVEESIINDVIQEGLDRIEVINEKKNTAIREARKAEADFNIDVFEQQANLAKEYNDEIESTISAMNARVRQVEQDERERLNFRQAQEERNSLILAGELINATPEQIMQAAALNGIEPGLLTKAVNDAKYEASTREFEEKSNALTLEQKRATLAKTYQDINGSGSDDEPVDIPTDVERGFISAGLSKTDAEDAWKTMAQFGLDGAVSIWLEGGSSKEEVKSIVSAFEKSQRTDKDDDGNLKNTPAQERIYAFIDNFETKDNRSEIQKKVDEDREKGVTISSSTNFFK